MIDTYIKLRLITPIKTITTYIRLTTEHSITDKELKAFATRCLRSVLVSVKVVMFFNKAESLGAIDFEELDNNSFVEYERMSAEQARELTAQGVEWIKG